MTKLSVNVNKVATLRNTRNLELPSVVRAARACVEAGAHGITVHPRPDERHIRPSDVRAIHAMLQDFPAVEYNLEGNPFHGFLQMVEEIRPHQATLVPDSVEAFTSDHGWDIKRDGERLRPILERLKAADCRVSLFMDPDPEAIALCGKLGGVDRVELYTEPYAASFTDGPNKAILQSYVDSAKAAVDAGLGINAGHDLNLQNLGPFLDAVPGVEEVSIGHALIADALFMGLTEVVRRYRALCGDHR